MAYMSQEQKTKLAAGVALVMPKGWKYSLAVRHHSAIVLTISAAPVDLLSEYVHGVNTWRSAEGRGDPCDARTHTQVNRPHLDAFKGATHATMTALFAALNEGNHDRSDSQSDYYDVGWYVDVRIGQYKRPFVCTTAPKCVQSSLSTPNGNR